MTLPHKRVLVTGATGFIGRHLCSALVKEGSAVHALILDTELSPPLKESKNVTQHQGSITDAAFVTELLTTVKPEVIFHLAAYGTFGHEQDVDQMIQVNIAGTQHLLRAAQACGCRAFVHTGSVKEYPTSRLPLTEQTPLVPWDNYAASKAAANLFCRLASNQLSLTATTLRLAPVYGPDDATTRFVPSVIRAALKHTPLPLSVGTLVRNFTYIDDTINALLAATTRTPTGYEEYNIGAPDAHSFADIVAAVEVATGETINKEVTDSTTARDDSWVIDSRKAEEQLGWKANVSLAEGIAQTVQWYRQQPMLS